MHQNRSSSPARPTEEFAHSALVIADTLAMLAYLVRLDAADPTQVCAYAHQMEERVSALQRLMLSAGWPSPAGDC